jgi:hypothetical protein
VGEVARLRALHPAHLRADLRLSEPGWEAELARARQEAAALGCRLELVLFLGDEAAAELARLAEQLATGLPLARLLVFHAGPATPERAVSTGPLVALARRHLQPVVGDVPFVGGTNVYFTELNRNRPDLTLVDGVAYSINPQVHAFDETSLVETLAAQGETVASARAFSDDRPLIVGPITLKPRFNPHARGPVPAPAPDELQPAVDPRQMALVGAVWTAGSLKYLAESGAATLTYYETTGWRGVLETAAGSPLPARFPSRPGQVFPLYHVFADAAEWAAGGLLTCQSSAPLSVVGLAVRSGPAVHLLVGNLTAADQPVTIGPLANPVVQLRRLAAGQVPLAVAEPARFRTDRVAATTSDGRVTLTLRPYELLRLDDVQP